MNFLQFNYRLQLTYLYLNSFWRDENKEAFYDDGDVFIYTHFIK